MKKQNYSKPAITSLVIMLIFIIFVLIGMNHGVLNNPQPYSFGYFVVFVFDNIIWFVLASLIFGIASLKEIKKNKLKGKRIAYTGILLSCLVLLGLFLRLLITVLQPGY